MMNWINDVQNIRDCEEVLGVELISMDERIYFLCYRRSEMWNPRTVFGIVKNNRFNRISIRKGINVALTENITKANLDEAIKKGDAIYYSPEELQEIAINLGYFEKVSDENIWDTVQSLFYIEDGDFMRRVRSILTPDEMASFKEWENLVGYELLPPLFKRTKPIKSYNSENWEVESAIYVIMHSERLLNAVIYLHDSLCEYRSREMVLKYLEHYSHKDSFIEIMHFSEWNQNNPDSLMEKYDIKDEVVDREDKSFLRRNDASVRVGENYKMVTQIRASFDDWDGIAVIVPRTCDLSPMDIVNVGEITSFIEDNFCVKNQLVRC